jgi:hypothetical protein
MLEMAEAIMVMEAVRTVLIILAAAEEVVGLQVVVVWLRLLVVMVVQVLLFCILIYNGLNKQKEKV